MKHDLKSNFAITENFAAGLFASGANSGAAIDMSLYLSAAFALAMTLDGTSGNVVCKLQHSADGSTDWTDEVAGAGNTSDALTLTNDGDFGVLHVINPRRRYYKVLMTSDVADAAGVCVAIAGPKTSVTPT